MTASPPDSSDPALVATPTGAGEPGSRGKGPRQVRAGDTLDRYELGEELGEGGMATVFRARDRELRRDVALKVLFPHLARRPEIVRRFHRESRAAAGLEHPNILRIYDVGGGDGDDPPYIVMELIRGRTLLQEIEQRGAMLAEIAACIGALLGDALAAAHAAGVIHRDIKPANVLIAPGGRLLLADFGVARLETEDSLITRTGALLGTPAYMSPEQASGDAVTALSDLYSLGATLYQLSTGALPFGGSPAKVMSMIAAGTFVAPVRRRPACGADLSRLIERAMAIDPRLRPPSAAAIGAELRGLAVAGGLGDANEELAAYFEDPDRFLRTRTPTVITTLVSTARTALAEAKLPRAMALADRASVLAPGDPEVAALIQTVTDGGRASRRKRGLAVGGIAVAIVGGLGALGWQLSRSTAANRPPVARAPIAIDPAPPSPIVTPIIDAAPLDLPPGDASVVVAVVTDAAPPPDARAQTLRPVRDAALRRREAPTLAPVDAAAPEPPAAPVPEAVDPAPRIDAAPERPSGPSYVVVQSNLWCSVYIDDAQRGGQSKGDQRNMPIGVSPGHHVVYCVNPTAEWHKDVDVAPGATRTVAGRLYIEITLDVDATIDGTRYQRGAVVKLEPGNVEVIVGDRKQFIAFRSACTLRDTPALGCYVTP